MIKYLAGIFAKPDNCYVNGRLATPLTPVGPSKKVPVPHPHQCPQMNSGETPAPVGETRRPRGRSNCQVTRSFTRTPEVQQVPDPDSYIVNVLASSSSNDESRDCMAPEPRPIFYDSSLKERLDEGRSSFLQTQIPDPPPASPVQSWMSLGADDGVTDTGAVTVFI